MLNVDVSLMYFLPADMDADRICHRLQIPFPEAYRPSDTRIVRQGLGESFFNQISVIFKLNSKRKLVICLSFLCRLLAYIHTIPSLPHSPEVLPNQGYMSMFQSGH